MSEQAFTVVVLAVGVFAIALAALLTRRHALAALAGLMAAFGALALAFTAAGRLPATESPALLQPAVDPVSVEHARLAAEGDIAALVVIAIAMAHGLVGLALFRRAGLPEATITTPPTLPAGPSSDSP